MPDSDLFAAREQRADPDLNSDTWLTEIDHEVVADCIGRLSARDRSILHLHYGHGLTDREIGEVLDRREDAVVQQRRRIIRKLRDTVCSRQTG